MTPLQVWRAASMWRTGKDTLDIARVLQIPEALVWASLDEIKRFASTRPASVSA